MGTINVKEGVEVGTKQSSWYDHTFVIYPFTGEFDWSRMTNALTKRFGRQFLNKFGGQRHIGTVELVHPAGAGGPGWIEVEHLYSIGD